MNVCFPQYLSAFLLPGTYHLTRITSEAMTRARSSKPSNHPLVRLCSPPPPQALYMSSAADVSSRNDKSPLRLNGVGGAAVASLSDQTVSASQARRGP